MDRWRPSRIIRIEFFNIKNTFRCGSAASRSHETVRPLLIPDLCTLVRAFSLFQFIPE
jgi:hypothetical protein